MSHQSAAERPDVEEERAVQVVVLVDVVVLQGTLEESVRTVPVVMLALSDIGCVTTGTGVEAASTRVGPVRSSAAEHPPQSVMHLRCGAAGSGFAAAADDADAALPGPVVQAAA